MVKCDKIPEGAEPLFPSNVTVEQFYAAIYGPGVILPDYMKDKTAPLAATQPGRAERTEDISMDNQKWVLWESKQRQPDEKGALIPADEVVQYVVCDPSYDDFLVWPDLSPEKGKEIVLPEDWAELEYQEKIDWMEEELGEAQHYTDEVVELRECLAFDLNGNEFFDFEICTSFSGHEWLCNTDTKIEIFDPEFMTEMIIETPDTGTNGDKFELDYQEDPNSTDNRFGGMGEHAILYPIVTLDGQPTDKVLVRYWSQWQGSELDSGEIMTPAEVIEMLEYGERRGKEYPYMDSVREWLNLPELPEETE